MKTSPHIAPVGLGPTRKQLNYGNNMVTSSTSSIIQFVTGPIPIMTLACPCTPGLVLPSNHSYGYGSQSNPAPSRTCASPSFTILVQYAG